MPQSSQDHPTIIPLFNSKMMAKHSIMINVVCWLLVLTCTAIFTTWTITGIIAGIAIASVMFEYQKYKQNTWRIITGKPHA